jgi:hypothetical protein
MTDDTVKTKAKGVISEKGIVYTLKNPKDRDIIRALKFRKIALNKVRAFKDHFFDKTRL